jgi:hypothetical protein
MSTDTDWTVEEMCAEFGVPNHTPKQRSHRVDLMPLAEAVRMALRKRDARIAALEGEVQALRAEFNTAKKLDDIAARLDRVEASRGLARGDLN